MDLQEYSFIMSMSKLMQQFAEENLSKKEDKKQHKLLDNFTLQNQVIDENGIISFDTALQFMGKTAKNKAKDHKGDDNMPYLKEGSLRKKYRGKQTFWEARYYHSGKQYSVYGKTQKECLEKLSKAIEAKKKGLLPSKTTVQSNYTLFNWLDTWFDTYKVRGAKLSPSHLNSIRICINKHIKSNINDIDLKRLTGFEIQSALNRIESSRMRKYTYDVFSECLRKAQSLKLIKEDPMLSVDPVKHVREKGNALTLEEQTNFIKAIENHELKYLYLFYLFTGCRPGEALLVRYEDIDVDHETIYIHGTKTVTSDRVLPLFPHLKQLIELIPHNGEYLFKVPYKRAENEFKSICANHTLKDLRHTFATRALESGISTKVVQKWMGHSKIDTTANIYTHVMDEFSRRESEKFTTIMYPCLYPYSAPNNNKKGKDDL